MGCEFRSTIGGEFIADAVCQENMVQGGDESTSTMGCLLNDVPVTVPIHDHQVVVALMVKVVGHCALEDGRGMPDLSGEWGLSWVGTAPSGCTVGSGLAFT